MAGPAGLPEWPADDVDARRDIAVIVDQPEDQRGLGAGQDPARSRVTVRPAIEASGPSATGWSSVMLKNASRPVVYGWTRLCPWGSTSAASKASLMKLGSALSKTSCRR